MIAQTDGIACLLQRDVLLAPKNIQGANRRVEIFAAKQKGAYGPINTVEIARLVKPPATPYECKERVNAVSHDHNIERVTVGIAGLVGRATMQLRQLFT